MITRSNERSPQHSLKNIYVEKFAFYGKAWSAQCECDTSMKEIKYKLLENLRLNMKLFRMGDLIWFI